MTELMSRAHGQLITGGRRRLFPSASPYSIAAIAMAIPRPYFHLSPEYIYTFLSFFLFKNRSVSNADPLESNKE